MRWQKKEFLFSSAHMWWLLSSSSKCLHQSLPYSLTGPQSRTHLWKKSNHHSLTHCSHSQFWLQQSPSASLSSEQQWNSEIHWRGAILTHNQLCGSFSCVVILSYDLYFTGMIPVSAKNRLRYSLYLFSKKGRQSIGHYTGRDRKSCACPKPHKLDPFSHLPLSSCSFWLILLWEKFYFLLWIWITTSLFRRTAPFSMPKC